MNFTQGLLTNTIQYISFHQMKAFAHTCSFARDIVLAWLREHPWTTSPFGDVFERSSLTLLKQITIGRLGKKVNVTTRYIDGNDGSFICNFAELVMHACRHDDVDLVRYIMQDVLEVHENHPDSISQGNLIVASLPSHFGHMDAHDFYQNRMHSVQVFMYLIGNDSPDIAPLYALRECDINTLLEYIASGAVVTSNEKLLRRITGLHDLTGIDPERYYRPGFSAQISPRIHDLARAAGMQMREYENVPSSLAMAISCIKDPKLLSAPRVGGANSNGCITNSTLAAWLITKDMI